METKINLDDVMEIKVDLNNLTEEEREKLLSLVEKAKKPKSKGWKPKKDEDYFIINENGDVFRYHYNYGEPLKKVLPIGNCFKTEEEAENAVERLKIRADLQRYADEQNDEEIDWTNDEQDRWCICFDNDNKRFVYMYNLAIRNAFQIYFTSEEIAQDAVKAVGEERIKKYLFGVEE